MTVEEASIGGLGAHVLTLASDPGLIDAGLKLRTMRLPDRFQDQDKPEKQYADAGLDADAHRRDGAEGAAAQQRRGGRGRAGLSWATLRRASIRPGATALMAVPSRPSPCWAPGSPAGSASTPERRHGPGPSWLGAADLRAQPRCRCSPRLFDARRRDRGRRSWLYLGSNGPSAPSLTGDPAG